MKVLKQTIIGLSIASCMPAAWGGDALNRWVLENQERVLQVGGEIIRKLNETTTRLLSDRLSSGQIHGLIPPEPPCFGAIRGGENVCVERLGTEIMRYAELVTFVVVSLAHMCDRMYGLLVAINADLETVTVYYAERYKPWFRTKTATTDERIMAALHKIGNMATPFVLIAVAADGVKYNADQPKADLSILIRSIGTARKENLELAHAWNIATQKGADRETPQFG
jgi:hypothetical protein